MSTPCLRLGGITKSNYWHSSVCLPSISLFVWTLSPSSSVSLATLHGALYLSPPGFNFKFCLSLNSHVISCQARRGSVCAGFGFYTELPMFSTLPHSISHFLSTSLSLPPFFPYIYIYVHFTHFSCCFNAYLFRKHMLSVLHYPATFPLSSSSFVRSVISENVDNHCALILIKLIDSTCIAAAVSLPLSWLPVLWLVMMQREWIWVEC